MDRLSELGFHISVIPESVSDAILIYGYFRGGTPARCWRLRAISLLHSL